MGRPGILPREERNLLLKREVCQDLVYVQRRRHDVRDAVVKAVVLTREAYRVPIL